MFDELMTPPLPRVRRGAPRDVVAEEMALFKQSAARFGGKG